MNINLLRGSGSLVSPPQVWSLDHSSAQITWGWLADEVINLRFGSQSVTVSQAPGPGAVRLTGLEPDRLYELQLTGKAGQALVEQPLTFRTPPRPPGKLLFQIATISDMHLGSRRWGVFNTMDEQAGQTTTGGEHSAPTIVAGKAPGPYPELHPIRCARSAVDDAVAWGADLLVTKGDSVQHETAECYELLGDLVDSVPDLPMMAIPGNHDVDKDGRYIPDYVGDRKLPICRDVDYEDRPGVRVVIADTSIPDRGKGTISRVGSAVLDAVAESDRPVLLFTHHQFQPGRVARYWPIGVTAPESTEFLDRLSRLKQQVVISSGHTHRNRVRRHGSILLTEVASTKDWPCVWAGYNIYEGGLEQTIYRVSEQSAMAWAEYSRLAVGGLWARWSPGKPADRSVREIWSTSSS